MSAPNPAAREAGRVREASRRDAFPERAGVQGHGCRRSGPESSRVPADLAEPGHMLENFPLTLALWVGLGKPHVVFY